MNETLVDRNNITLRDRLKNMVASFGLPRLIIAGFLHSVINSVCHSFVNAVHSLGVVHLYNGNAVFYFF